MGLVGSTLTGPLMFIFPPIFFLKLCYIKSNISKNDPKLLAKNKLLNKENGVANGNKQNGAWNNGDLSKMPLIFSDSLRKYRTFSNNIDTSYKRIDEDYVHDEYAIKWYDVLLALIVMTMGIGATVVATYSSWANSIEYYTYSPPCLVNATVAARSFLEMTFQS